MFIARAMCGLTAYVTVAALWSSCCLRKYLERCPGGLKLDCQLRVELNIVHFQQHYSLFVQNKLQYTWRRDYCECVQPAQLPVLTRSSSSVPPGTTSTMRSPHGPRRMQQKDEIAFCSSLYGTFKPTFRELCLWNPINPIDEARYFENYSSGIPC
jgi:hypothetical protein